MSITFRPPSSPTIRSSCACTTRCAIMQASNRGSQRDERPGTTLVFRSPVFVCLFAAPMVARAQYPLRPILLVVPYTAGSDADLAARNLAQHAPRYLNGQALVVMNQPGASGAIGTLAVRNAAPDGYRLLLSRIASQVILPATDRKAAYGANDFAFLSLLEINPY